MKLYCIIIENILLLLCCSSLFFLFVAAEQKASFPFYIFRAYFGGNKQIWTGKCILLYWQLAYTVYRRYRCCTIRSILVASEGWVRGRTFFLAVFFLSLLVKANKRTLNSHGTQSTQWIEQILYSSNNNEKNVIEEKFEAKKIDI